VRGVGTHSLGEITADLVVVSTGRAGQLPGWLDQLGLQAPPVEELQVDLLYASRHLALAPAALGGDKMVLITPVPGLARGLGLFAQEDGTWLLTAVGWGKQNHPPADLAGHVAFVESFAPPEVCAAIRAATDLDDVVMHAFPANRRRRYDRLTSFPEGLLVIGDAISSFNPAYGQGMSVAAQEALAMERCLAAGTRRLARRYFRAIHTPVNAAWDQAIGSDLALPEIAGHRSVSVRLGNAWVSRVLAAAEHDAKVAERFAAVTDLLAPPTALFGPALVWRVLRGRRSGPGRASTLRSVKPPARTTH
jgi:2-polyprenyl-6-methoxyphenol hydroxylase-like FAD-dependent oxidoreductase